ncbi:MAG TPA: DNA internalization-related competence protein ComEC/Rec2, partial [Candidatus Binataceae bacterium]|nr:DNA internalization-related competence protein ComEC/Rec2 [Candidatus Binataceae bacterium]
GDKIRITARIRFPRDDGNPGQFDYRAWLLRQGIAATMFVGPPKAKLPPAISVIAHRDPLPAAMIEKIRKHIGAFIDTNLHYPENAEMRALIIGDRGSVDESLRQSFALTGMAHLLVISGLHLGFVAAVAFFAVRLAMGLFPALMARGYANPIAATGAATAAIAYASIAGHHVSTIRALVMVLSYAVSIMIGRARELVASLALAALVICFALPGSTADIGFQLSFASVLVIVLGMRRFDSWWRRRHTSPFGLRMELTRANVIAEWIAGYVAVSFWALLGTAPLTALHFNQFSIVGLVANAVVVPIMGFGAVIFGLGAAAMNFVWAPPARALLSVAGGLAHTGTYLARWFALWPFAWSRIFTPTIIEVAIAYGFVLLWLQSPLDRAGVRIMGETQAIASATRRRAGRRIVVAILAAALVVDAAWWIYQRNFNPDLRVTFLSVGEGDAAVVRFPGSRVMLIDGGGSFFGAFDPGERIVAPYLWANKIMHVDYLVVSHPDRDHFAGFIFVAHNFTPSEFWTGGTSSPDKTYAALIDAVRAAGSRERRCDASSPPMVIGDVAVRCLGPQPGVFQAKDNNASMVMALSYGRTTLLFPGDLEAKGEHELIAARAHLAATILKVPHHGSRTSSSDAFVEAVHPAAAVISLGYLNRFHFPAPEVLSRYAEHHVRALRTDETGAVTADVSIDSLRLWTFRGGEVRLERRSEGFHP